jgi:hypothetical protein
VLERIRKKQNKSQRNNGLEEADYQGPGSAAAQQRAAQHVVRSISSRFVLVF